MKFFTAIAAALLASASAMSHAQGIPPGLRLQPNGEQKPSAAVPMNSPLPATQPTLPQAAPAQLVQQRSTTTISTVRRAQVAYVNGQLTVVANNSSLNQILREVARQTGITISGGVTDERVFGTYGPSDLPTILETLLDGTGSNMMLSGDSPSVPKVLTLTPRQGGVTPPSPAQVAHDDDDAPQQQDLPPQLTPRTANNRIGQPQSENPPQPQVFTPPTATATQPDSPAPAATTTTEQSPNGVKTPQQIYDQLMKLQSQQPKAPQ